ncbi:MAG TPA: hypothetical protein VD978_25825 [Azospirillum sp.]|nr:hypothetical protein [Azospirillum sp.]
MTSKNRLLSVLLATMIAGGAGTAMAAAGHSHDGHAATTVELTLKNGKKWPTDEALRHGMGEIRSAVAATLKPIHKNTLDPAGYQALAARIEGQVDVIVKDCRLPDAADAQLHLVLARILEGVEAMKAGPGRRDGAVGVVQALDAYGKHFDHTGWKPLAH